MSLNSGMGEVLIRIHTTIWFANRENFLAIIHFITILLIDHLNDVIEFWDGWVVDKNSHNDLISK